jgi:hypothetical protein
MILTSKLFRRGVRRIFYIIIHDEGPSGPTAENYGLRASIEIIWGFEEL